MSDIQKRVNDFFDSMDRDEFVDLLKVSGFELEDGEGRVIFDEEEDYSIEGEKTFSIKSTYKSTNRLNTNNVAGSFPLAS